MKALLFLLACVITTLAATSCSCCPGGGTADPQETHGAPSAQTPAKKAGY